MPSMPGIANAARPAWSSPCSTPGCSTTIRIWAVADRGGKLLPGFDFVSRRAHGQRRQCAAMPTLPIPVTGSTRPTRPTPLFANCDTTASSWHGTRVAGMIGALTNNSAGVAGLDWNSFILPVRVLGQMRRHSTATSSRACAGRPVSTCRARRTIRLRRAFSTPSFGNDGPCEPTYRDVIEELTARKVLLVISAGNEGTWCRHPATVRAWPRSRRSAMPAARWVSAASDPK